jgi:hypothetical protein
VRAVGAFGAIAVAADASVYWNFGTLSPCGVLRETARQYDSLAAMLPDSAVDLWLTGQYGALSPGRCLAGLINHPNPTAPGAAQAPPLQSQTPALATSAPSAAPPPPVAAQDPMQKAAQATTQAGNECRARRLRGELPNHVASARCSNPAMIAAFHEANYRYMDLIEFFAAKRLEFAAKIDRGELTEQQAQLESNKVYANIQATEKQRDRSIK